MLNLKEQVASLELSKELKAVGVPQESYFWWVKDMFGNGYKLENWKGQYAEGLVEVDTYFAAFSVAELGEMLPMSIIKNEKAYDFETIRLRAGKGQLWLINYRVSGQRHPVAIADGNTEANARAKMVLYLVKEGLLKF